MNHPERRRWFRGLTLIEIMVVICLATLILGPAYQILQSGMKTSLQGMTQIDMVLEARRIIRQIHADLKGSCIELDPTRRYTLLDYLITRRPDANSLHNTTFTFLAFPLHYDKDKAISRHEKTGKSPRLANEITYRLEKGAGPFYRIIREEKINPLLGTGVQKKILTERGNFLHIQPIEVQTSAGSNQWFFSVTLQLAEARHPKDLVADRVRGGRTHSEPNERPDDR